MRSLTPSSLFIAIAAASVAVTTASPVAAGIIWNEQINGDFSGNRFAPTPIVLPVGESEIFGRMEYGGGGLHVDLDYFSLTIPAGHQLMRMTLTTYLSVDTAAFMAIQPGPTFPNDPDTVMPEDLMGWSHFGPTLVGLDLLTAMGLNGNNGGFAPPLAAGVYSFWAQQTDDFTEYGLAFTVEPVPAPSALAIGVLALAAQRRRRPHATQGCRAD